MKQIIIGKKVAYATVSAKYEDFTTVSNGTIALFNLNDGKLISTAAGMTGNFAIVCGRGADKMPIVVPEVDKKSMTVVKAVKQDGVKFKAEFTVGTPKEGEYYTAIISKGGTHLNQRVNWTFMVVAKKGSTANTVAADLVKQIKNSAEYIGVKAVAENAKVTIEALEVGTQFHVTLADSLSGVDVTVTTPKDAILSKAWVQDLAQQCASAKGFDLLSEDGKSLYPGYPETVDADDYTMYTLSFAVPRAGGKTRDEVVTQVVHICLPIGAGAITTLDAIFGLTVGVGG